MLTAWLFIVLSIAGASSLEVSRNTHKSSKSLALTLPFAITVFTAEHREFLLHWLEQPAEMPRDPAIEDSITVWLGHLSIWVYRRNIAM